MVGWVNGWGADEGRGCVGEYSGCRAWRQVGYVFFFLSAGPAERNALQGGWERKTDLFSVQCISV